MSDVLGPDNEYRKPERAALSVLSPRLGALADLLAGVKERRDRRMQNFVSEAADEASMSPEHLSERVLRDDRLIALLEDALGALRADRDEAHVGALVLAVARGVLATDSAVIDDQLLIMYALRQLDPPHLRALLYLDHEERKSPAEDYTGQIVLFQTRNDLVKSGWHRGTATAVIARLEHLGILTSVGSEAGIGPHGITEFGRSVLEYLTYRARESHIAPRHQQ